MGDAGKGAKMGDAASNDAQLHDGKGNAQTRDAQPQDGKGGAQPQDEKGGAQPHHEQGGAQPNDGQGDSQPHDEKGETPHDVQPHDGQGGTPQSGVMRINLPNLVKLLGERLYSDPNAAIRELVQNAHDACEIQRAVGSMQETPRISIDADTDALRLTVKDNGTGLTREQVDEFLTVIGNSQTDRVREELETLGRKSEADRLIGRFGLGLLSAFTIGHRVEFLTRAHGSDAETIRWWCDGGTEWNMVCSASDDFAPGTLVSIDVDARHVDLLNLDYLTSAIRRYTEFLDVEVYVGSSAQPVNAMTPPWVQGGSDADYRAFLQRRFPHEEILAVIPVDVRDDVGSVELHGVLFIPDEPSLLVEEYGDMSIYCHRYYVCDDNRTLLPSWARFVRGVIDTPSLKEMTDREHVVEDAIFERAKDLLGKHILAYLEDAATNEPQVLDEIVRRHNITIKAWALSSDELFQCVRNRVLFKVDGSRKNLGDYLLADGADQPAGRRIYCSSKPGAVSQFVVLARARGCSIIDAASFPDLHFLERYTRDEPDIELIDLDTSGIGGFDPATEPPERWGKVEHYFERRDVAAHLCYFEPARISAVLTRQSAAELDLADLDELLQMPDLDQTIKRYLRVTRDRMTFESTQRSEAGEELYVNARSAIVQALLELELTEMDLEDVLDALYNNALLLSCHGEEVPVEVLDRVFDGQTRVIAAFLAQAAAKASPPPLEPTKAALDGNRHVMCFLARPFDSQYDHMQGALENVLCGPPYFFEIARADDKYFKRTVEDNVEDWITHADCFAVDISGTNPSVMMELGLIYWHYRERPLLLLCGQDVDVQDDVADLKGTILVRYPSNPEARQTDIEQFFNTELEKVPQLRQFVGRKHFLSTTILEQFQWLADPARTRLATSFATIEDFLAAPPETVRSSVDKALLPDELLPRLRDELERIVGVRGT